MNPWAVDGDADYCPAGSPWAMWRHQPHSSSLKGSMSGNAIIAANCQQCREPIVLVRAADSPNRWVWTRYLILEEEF